MTPFPGHIHREPWGKCGRIVLTDEQKEWLREVYPLHPNCDIAKAMGVNTRRLSNIAHILGLHKDAGYLEQVYQRNMRICIAHNFRTGQYHSETYKEQARKWRLAGRKAWHDKLAAMTDAERKAWHLKRGRATHATRQADIKRVNRGMPQRTKFRNLTWQYDQRHFSARYHARKRNYILTPYPSGAERYRIYYDNETNRSARFEKHLASLGFRILEDK